MRVTGTGEGKEKVNRKEMSTCNLSQGHDRGDGAYATAERSETGKLNDLCSLQVLMFKSLIDSRTQT